MPIGQEAEEASASIAIIAARQEPGLPDEPTQLEPKSSECFGDRQLVAAEK
jgi:hypothetical protein